MAEEGLQNSNQAQPSTVFDKAVTKIERARKASARRLGFGDLRTLESLPRLDLPDVIDVNLSGTRINDLSSLEGCYSIRRLALSKTPIKDLKPISQLIQLRELYLDKTLVADLSPLANLINLEILVLENTPVRDASPLAGLSSLRELNMSRTKIFDTSFLASLRNLEDIDLSRTQIRELSALADIKKLHRLSVAETLVSDLSPLSKLVNLGTLNLDGSRVADLTPLAPIISLLGGGYRRSFFNGTYRIGVGFGRGGLSFKGCPISDPILLEFARLPEPGRAHATISYLRRQVGLPDVLERGRQVKEGRVDLQPLMNVPSPFAFHLVDGGNIALESNAANFPLFPHSSSKRDHTNRLEVCRSLAQDLVSELKSGKFQARELYELGLEKYASRLPTEVVDGNILLADAEARTLRSLFAAEFDILSVGFAAKLKTFLEQHIGLRVFYPEIGNFYRDVQSGRIEEPLPLDAVVGFVSGIKNNTPVVFDPSVQNAIEESSALSPATSIATGAHTQSVDANQPMPPKDPLGDVDPKKAWDFTFAGTANNLWKVFRDGEKFHKSVDGWQKAGTDLAPHINKIIDWLSRFLSSGDGTPPMPPTMGV